MEDGTVWTGRAMSGPGALCLDRARYTMTLSCVFVMSCCEDLILRSCCSSRYYNHFFFWGYVVVVLQVVLFPLFSIHAHVHRSYCHFGLASNFYCGWVMQHAMVVVLGLVHSWGRTVVATSQQWQTSGYRYFRLVAKPLFVLCRPCLSSMVEFFLVTMYIRWICKWWE